jgi:hypothetical protein
VEAGLRACRRRTYGRHLRRGPGGRRAASCTGVCGDSACGSRPARVPTLLVRPVWGDGRLLRATEPHASPPCPRPSASYFSEHALTCAGMNATPLGPRAAHDTRHPTLAPRGSTSSSTCDPYRPTVLRETHRSDHIRPTVLRETHRSDHIRPTVHARPTGLTISDPVLRETHRSDHIRPTVYTRPTGLTITYDDPRETHKIHTTRFFDTDRAARSGCTVVIRGSSTRPAAPRTQPCVGYSCLGDGDHGCSSALVERGAVAAERVVASGGEGKTPYHALQGRPTRGPHQRCEAGISVDAPDGGSHRRSHDQRLSL